MINRNFKDFEFLHKKKQNQVLFISKKIRGDSEILNLIENFLKEKNSFIFESVEKGIIKGRYTIFGKNLIKYGSLIIQIRFTLIKIIIKKK